MKITTLLTGLLLCLPAFGWTRYFDFETVPAPSGVDPQVGALQTLPDGRIAAAFHRGEVMFYDPVSGEWSLFASGLQEPLGMLVENAGRILVMQRAELTRLVDTDRDGVADRYETVCDAFGMTGNYHEFAFGPAKGPDGSLYIALGVASNQAPIREEIRGGFSEIGRLDRKQMTDYREWNENKDLAGRMYSRAPYRGWIMRISADGSTVEPYASGFRSPNGIGFDAGGRLLVTDNQGDWRPSSPLYVVEKGKFYGHPASLVWTPDWDGRDPDLIKPEELEAMSQQPAGYFPQGELANSPTEPVVMTKGSVPASLAGQTLIGEMNQGHLIRVIHDEVRGVHQVALVAMFDGSPLGNGNNRITIGADGSIYVGKSALSWAGSHGITRIKWKGGDFFALEGVKARRGGFALRFSQEIDESTLSALRMKRHTYLYTSNYGSPKVDESELPLGDLRLASDKRTVTFKVDGLKEKYLHQIDASGVKNKKGEELMGKKAWYYVARTPD